MILNKDFELKSIFKEINWFKNIYHNIHIYIKESQINRSAKYCWSK